MPIFNKYNLIFIHIPKNLGTSITAWFGYSGDNSAPDLDVLFGQYQGRQLQHLTFGEMSEFVDTTRLNGYSYLAVIRSPYDRLISEYRWLKGHSFWSKHLEKHLMTFRSFLSYIEELYDSGKLLKSFVHWYPQSVFIEGLEGSEKLYLISFDWAVEELGGLNVRLGWNISLPIPYLNVSTYQFNLTEEDSQYLDYIVKKVYSKDIEIYSSLSREC